MLEKFTCATFERHLGGPFLLHAGSGPPVEVILVEATLLPAMSRADTQTDTRTQARAPFSIVFRQASGPILPQAIYRVEHSDIGTFELFLVPIGPDGGGMRYEAVFT